MMIGALCLGSISFLHLYFASNCLKFEMLYDNGAPVFACRCLESSSQECVQRSAAVALSAKTPAVAMELPVKEAHSR